MYPARPRRSVSVVHAILAALVTALCVLQAPAAQAMSFELVSGPSECAARPCILASGAVEKATAAAFVGFIRAQHVAPGALVVLNSEGGYLLQGIRLGEEIRRAGLTTAVNRYDAAAQAFVPGDCASACAFAFLGGVRRDVGPGSRIGVHQIYANLQANDGISVGDVQMLTSLTAMHIDNMGGNVGILIEALRTPPEQVHWFSGAELGRLAIVTRRGDLTLASN